jgi:hypothetical protein
MNEEFEPPSEPGVAVVGGRPADTEEESAPRGASAGVAKGKGPFRPVDLLASVRRLFSGADEQPRTVGGAAQRRRSTSPWLVPFLLILTALSLIAAIGFALAWSNLQSQQNTKTTVTRVARDFLLSLTNFTPANLDNRLSNLSTYATGDFAKQENQFFGTSIRQALQKVQASSRGQIRYIYVQTLNGDQATVYAWVDQTFINNKLTSPQTDVLQVSLGMFDRPAGWKIGSVSVLNSPNPTSPTP